ncbi:3-hydroxyacyl-[acyl-carrier-protein] dehydratase, FabZ form [hydrothermal vent metagenome]|uniref:3-hydroxyacyl-[acyl-carrier-protein] dehydratase n=1 Tax=hydrothermal vent metagenome TaxID=652676 RepID=A0A3B1AXT2_9ZZZZ
MNSMDINEVLKYLPHRYPFLLIDRVLDYQVGEYLEALKNVSHNEPHFTGHFPRRPVMPGVLITESLAQATSILATLSSSNTTDDSLFYLAGIDNARFKRQVEPGDQLHLRVDFIKEKRGIWKFATKASVEGQLACSAEIICAERTI